MNKQPEITEYARHELMDEMREIDHQMRTLGESERKVLPNEVAQAIEPNGIFAEVLDVFYGGKRDELTIGLLNHP